MNKREKERLCAMLAEWEWFQGGSSSEASGRNHAARGIRELFPVTDEDLAFYRAWEIMKLIQADPNEDDEFFDALSDMAEENYEALVDLVEGTENCDLRAAVLA